jgi:uncharacterized protein YktA (UPF0223 family)
LSDRIEISEDNIKVSFSSLTWLEESPAYFRAMSNGDLPKPESQFMDFGKALHCYILRRDDFPKEYYVLKAIMPANAQQHKFCAEYRNNKGDIVEAYKASYSIKSKTSDTIKSEAEKLIMTLKPYIDSISDSEGKKIISFDDFERITSIADNILVHKGAKKLFEYMDNHKDCDVFTEKEFMLKGRKLHDGKDLWIHGFVDHIIFDPKNRKMIINELKTTSKPLSKYREAFSEYHTARQLAIYTIAAGKIFETMYPDIPLKEVTPEWNVIVAQTNTLYEVRVFNINQVHIEQGMIEYKDLINRYVFHYENGWDFPQEYYTNEGVEYL